MTKEIQTTIDEINKELEELDNSKKEYNNPWYGTPAQIGYLKKLLMGWFTKNNKLDLFKECKSPRDFAFVFKPEWADYDLKLVGTFNHLGMVTFWGKPKYNVCRAFIEAFQNKDKKEDVFKEIYIG